MSQSSERCEECGESMGAGERWCWQCIVAERDHPYGPCHFCGEETPDRHCNVLVSCNGHGAEICEQCNAAAKRGEEMACPIDDDIAWRARLAR